MKYENMYIDKHKIMPNSNIFTHSIENSDKIFHYTSSDGLKSILKNKTLWFSDIRYMNDMMEIREGIKAMKEIAEESESEDIRNITVPFYNEYLDKAADNLLNDNIYICSFSIGRDELPMWNYYTKDNACQGYNVCFSIDPMMQSLIKINKDILDGCSISYGKVEYYKDSIKPLLENHFNALFHIFLIKHPKYVQEILEKVVCELGKKFSMTEQERRSCNAQIVEFCSGEGMNISEIESNMLNIYKFDSCALKFDQLQLEEPVCYIKNSSFEYEKEIRIIIRIPKDKLEELKKNRIYKERYCNGLKIPYIELSFSQDAVEGITVAPMNKDVNVEKEIEKYMDEQGYDISRMRYGIKKSEVPIRY